MTCHFIDEFFERIPEIFKNKSRFIAEAYYLYLAPTAYADEENINKFKSLLEKVQTNNPDNSHFINLLKDSIHDLEIAQKGKQLSALYREAQARNKE